MNSVHSFSAYDAKSLRLLSGVLFEVKNNIENSLKRPFGENERADVTRLVADRLMRIFDLGERNRDALMRAALEGFQSTEPYKEFATHVPMSGSPFLDNNRDAASECLTH